MAIMENKMETTSVCWAFLGFRVGIMENKMETTTISWGYIGIVEKKMETRPFKVQN